MFCCLPDTQKKVDLAAINNPRAIVSFCNVLIVLLSFFMETLRSMLNTFKMLRAILLGIDIIPLVTFSAFSNTVSCSVAKSFVFKPFERG